MKLYSITFYEFCTQLILCSDIKVRLVLKNQSFYGNSVFWVTPKNKNYESCKETALLIEINNEL